MNEVQTGNQIRGRAIGALFFAGFGAPWVLLSLYALQRLGAANIGGVALVAVMLLSGSLWLLRKAKGLPSEPDDPAKGRVFMRINALQWIAIAVVAFSFAKLHIDVYVMNAIAGIVGLHMFSLARLFRYPPHYLTGSLLVAWAAGSAFLVPAEHLQGIASLGTGAILWMSPAMTLGIAFQVTRQTTRTASSG
jgi:hypothetical protein